MTNKILLTFLLFLPFYGFAEANSDEVDYNCLAETLGHLIVRQLNQAGFQLNLDRVVQGILDERDGKPSPMSEEEYENMICTLQEQHFMKTAEKNLKEADSFLQLNATKEGIMAMEPKLQFSVTQEGLGESVGPESVPLIHYTGKLIDGTVFASSESIGEPIALPINQSIPGFAKGLVGMKEGEKRILYIHPELAYGLTGQLPPNSLLIFEVEIVKANSMSLSEVAQIDSPSTQEVTQ